MSQFSSFVDLVGVRHLAFTGDLETLRVRLESFHDSIGKSLHVLDDDHDKVHFLSDCIFVETHDDDGEETRLIKFLRTLRENLTPAGVFFKGCILPLPLESKDAGVFPGVSDSVLLRRQKILRGTWFSGDAAAHLFSTQETLKGIGIFSNLPNDTSKRFVTVSCYIPGIAATSGTATARSFFDISFAPSERNNTTLIAIRQALRASRSQDGIKIARYYMTPLVTWLNSIDFNVTPLSFEVWNDDQACDSFDPLLAAVFSDSIGKDMKGLSSLAYAQIHFAAASLVDRSEALLDRRIYNSMWNSLRKKDRMVDLLSRVPLEIFSASQRQKYLKD